MKNKKLIQQIQRGNKELLNTVIEKYYDEILHFCVYQVKDVSTSYDLTQETFYRFIRSVDRYEYGNLKGYLLTIARNLCVDYWKGKIATEPFEDAGQKCCDIDEYEGVENQMILVEMLSKLPEAQREVIILRFYSELKLSEISKILGVNISTVKSRLRLGIRSLQKELPKFKL